MRFLLEMRSHQIIEACSGPEGIAVARAVISDLILLDIQPLQMDGTPCHGVLRWDLSAGYTVLIVAFASTP